MEPTYLGTLRGRDSHAQTTDISSAHAADLHIPLSHFRKEGFNYYYLYPNEVFRWDIEMTL